jgi:hypothetical protein
MINAYFGLLFICCSILRLTDAKQIILLGSLEGESYVHIDEREYEKLDLKNLLHCIIASNMGLSGGACFGNHEGAR